MQLMKLGWSSFRPVKPLLYHFARLRATAWGNQTPLYNTCAYFAFVVVVTVGTIIVKTLFHVYK